METIDTSGRGTSGRCWQAGLDPSPCAAKRSADVGAPHSPPQACSSTRTARPARPEQTKSARSSRQFSRFCYAKDPDKVFGTQATADLEMTDATRLAAGLVRLEVLAADDRRASSTRSSVTPLRRRSLVTSEMQPIAPPPVCCTPIELPPGRLRHIWPLYDPRVMSGCLPDWMRRRSKRSRMALAKSSRRGDFPGG